MNLFCVHRSIFSVLSSYVIKFLDQVYGVFSTHYEVVHYTLCAVFTIYRQHTKHQTQKFTTYEESTENNRALNAKYSFIRHLILRCT